MEKFLPESVFNPAGIDASVSALTCWIVSLWAVGGGVAGVGDLQSCWWIPAESAKRMPPADLIGPWSHWSVLRDLSHSASNGGGGRERVGLGRVGHICSEAVPHQRGHQRRVRSWLLSVEKLWIWLRDPRPAIINIVMGHLSVLRPSARGARKPLPLH